jgi:hypothetical protein
MTNGVYHERRLTLSQAARHLNLHVSTVWRWQLRGVRGVRLETILLGGTRYTSHEALERFTTACTAAADGRVPAARTTTQRQRQIEQAERELAEAGI